MTDKFTVRSLNFDHHEPVPAESFAEALAVAKKRGWDASIYRGGDLVASWSILGGTHTWVPRAELEVGSP